jgi:hypothetical protein
MIWCPVEGLAPVALEPHQRRTAPGGLYRQAGRIESGTGGGGVARNRQLNTSWDVVLVPDGTPEEAEAAARRPRRMVARWILRNARNETGNHGENRE